MALADNLAIGIFASQSTPEWPATGWSASNPGGLGAPSVVDPGGGADPYFDIEASEGVLFVNSTPDLFAPGTGSFTIAAKIRPITTDSSTKAYLQFGNSSGTRGFRLCLASTVNQYLRLIVPSISTSTTYLRNATVITNDNADLIIALSRDTSLGTTAGVAYYNGASDYGAEEAAFDTLDMGTIVGENVSLGCDNAGANQQACRIYWAVAWNRALTAGELAALDRASLMQALGIGVGFPVSLHQPAPVVLAH